MKGTFNKKEQSFFVTVKPNKKGSGFLKNALGFGNTNLPTIKKIFVPDHMKDLFEDGKEYTIPRITPDTRQ